MNLLLRDISSLGIYRDPIGGISYHDLLQIALIDGKRFCQIVEEHDSGLVSLADDIRIRGLTFRPFRVYHHEQFHPEQAAFTVFKNPNSTFTVLSGNRRVLAVAYNHAKHGNPPYIEMVL